MINPSYEPSAGSFAAWVATAKDCIQVDLYTVTTPTGTVYRYSGGDVALTVSGNLFYLGPGIKRTKVRRTIGLSVDNMRLTIYADNTVTLGGIAYLSALRNGAYTGATILLETAYLDYSGTLKGVVPKFSGTVGQVTTTRTEAQIEVRSAADALSVMVPGEVYGAACLNVFGDGMCGVDLTALQVTGAALTATDSTRRIATVSGAGGLATSGWATLGQITMTSGLNAGASRGISEHLAMAPNQSRITVVRPWDYAIAATDTCTITPGCNKTTAACSGFGNILRFRGYPYIPAPETII